MGITSALGRASRFIGCNSQKLVMLSEEAGETAGLEPVEAHVQPTPDDPAPPTPSPRAERPGAP